MFARPLCKCPRIWPAAPLFQGLIAFAQGRLADAEADYEDTLSTFERMGDAEQVAAAHPLLASLYFYLGDATNEWRHRTAALQGLSISRSPRFKHALMVTAAMSVAPKPGNRAVDVRHCRRCAGIGRERGPSTARAAQQTLLAPPRAERRKRPMTDEHAGISPICRTSHSGVSRIAGLAAESDLKRNNKSGRSGVAASRAIETIEQRGDRTRVPQFYLRLAKGNIAGSHADADAHWPRAHRV